MRAYVIKSWSASNEPVDEAKNHVSIFGRNQGLLSWLLTVLGVSPTVSMLISAEQVQVSVGSLSGSLHTILPLENVCSTHYGFYKPWRESALILAAALVGGLLLLKADEARAALIVAAIGVTIAAVYYLLNQIITIGFVGNSGEAFTLGFKRSVIEGQHIDETSAAYVAQLTQALIDNRKSFRVGGGT